MQDAILTEEGAARLDRPELAGEIVQVESVSTGPADDPFVVARGVYYQGEKLCGIMSLSGKTPGLRWP